jgi:hypothetical protein
LKSTGPKTPEGKERSRCNAVRHGLTAETIIAALEDAENYQAFEAAVVSDYDAESAVERELVLRLASVLWRLRRATGIETAIFESVTTEVSKLEHGHLRPTLVEAAELPDRNQLHLVAKRQSDAVAGTERSFDAKKNIGDCFLRLAEVPSRLHLASILHKGLKNANIHASQQSYLGILGLKATNMLRFHELRQNPASVTFYDQTGARITIIAERLRQGLVNMTCQCRHHSEAGWCKHCLAVLCDQVILEDDQQSLALEGIVAGTRLKATANKLREVLEAFATAYRHMKRDLPAALDPDRLHNFATEAYQTGMAAHQLALAIEAFIKELRPTTNAK